MGQRSILHKDGAYDPKISHSIKGKHISEHELITGLIEKDRKAFEMLYEQYADSIYNTSISYLQNVEDAEEITQDVFITIFNKIEDFNQHSKLSTWIYRITVNKSLNFIKKRKRHQLPGLGFLKKDPTDFIHPGIQLEQKEEGIALFKQIDKLAPNQKTAFILVFVEHLPQQEVANIMKTSLKAVESLLQRAKAKLRTNINFYQSSKGKTGKKVSN